MLKISRQHAHFLFGFIQSGVTTSVASAVASFRFLAEGAFVINWLESWLASWVAYGADSILRCTGNPASDALVDTRRAVINPCIFSIGSSRTTLKEHRRPSMLKIEAICFQPMRQ